MLMCPRAFSVQYQQARTRAHAGSGDCALARRLTFGGTRWVSVGRARPAAGRAIDLRRTPAALVRSLRTECVISTREWHAAGLMPVQPDSHVCVQGVWYQPDAPRWHDNAFGAQFVLAYMRLVRAGEVRARRRRSTTWNAVQAERVAREAGVTLTSAMHAWPAGQRSASSSGTGRTRPQRAMQRARWHAVIAVAPPQLEAAAATLLRT